MASNFVPTFRESGTTPDKKAEGTKIVVRSQKSGVRITYSVSRIFLVSFLAFLAGCSTPSLEKARANFQAGRFAQADEDLKSIPAGDKDEVLYLCERGMIRQNLGKFDESDADFRAAAEINARLITYNLSKGAASLITNDRALPYRGMPFERTLVYTYLAKNYLAQSNWDYAAICARNIIAHLEQRDDFPDVSYSRYLAGFCLEMINDEGNAAIQYKAAAKLLNNLAIDEASGQIAAVASNATALAHSNNVPLQAAGSGELVCFIGMGRMPTWGQSGYDFELAPFAEIYCGEQYLGRSYPLANTAELMFASWQRMVALQMVKDVARIATKEAIAASIESQNATLGQIMRLILFSFEVPDTRCWETLPLWLEIARVPCPANLPSYKVVFKTSGGVALKSRMIEAPIARRGNVFVSFCRDLEPQSASAP